MTETPAEEPTPEFNFDEWIKNGTVRQKSVVIHNDAAIFDKVEALEKRRKEILADQRRTGGERSLSEKDELAEIEAKEAELAESWEASKATFTVRALDTREAQKVIEDHPLPPPPPMPDRNAPVQVKKRWEADKVDWAKKYDDALLEQNIAFVALAVVSVETPSGSVDHVSIEQLRAIYERPHGKAQFGELIKATNEVTTGDIEVPRPLLPASSAGRSGADS